MAMSHRQALEVLAQHRAGKVVITTMTSGGIWPELSNTALDFDYLPSSMGQGPDLGLGIALAGRGVIVVNGDGCMLMNLGALVTIGQQAVPLYLIIMNNNLYEVTGGQPTAGANRVDFEQVARGCGIARTRTFTDLASWQAGAAEWLSGPGPVVLVLSLEGRLGQKTPKPPRPMSEQISRLRQALASARTSAD